MSNLQIHQQATLFHICGISETAVHRLSKILRRYRAAIFTAATLILVLLSATAISIRYAFVADGSSREADSRRKEAEDSRIIADKERAEAQSQRDQAQRLRSDAVQQQERIREHLYIADMRLASLDLKGENIARLHTKLEEHVSSVASKDLRKWEWYYLQASGRAIA